MIFTNETLGSLGCSGWSMMDASEREDILKPLGLICDSGSYENENYSKKIYTVRILYSNKYQGGVNLTQLRFNKLLKVKTKFENQDQLSIWFQTLIREEKLQKINNGKL